VLRGIEVNDDTLGTDMLIEKGPGEDFLAEEHTVRHMRNEFFMPKLANRKKREQWSEDDSALARARQFVQKVRDSEQESKLPSDTRDEILDTFEEIRKA
jgi:trimethylamine--corrinoid protein Co-methyltransferase